VTTFNIRKPTRVRGTSLFLQPHDDFNLEPADVLLLGKIYDSMQSLGWRWLAHRAFCFQIYVVANFFHVTEVIKVSIMANK
jgi:hypothetical protein